MTRRIIVWSGWLLVVVVVVVALVLGTGRAAWAQGPPATFRLVLDPFVGEQLAGNVVVTGAAFDVAQPFAVTPIKVMAAPLRSDGVPLAPFVEYAPPARFLARPDVAADLGAVAYTDTGFSQTLAGLTPGFWHVFVVAFHANGSVSIAGGHLSVSTSLRGWIDVPTVGQVVAAGAPIAMTGWAIDWSYHLGTAGIERVTVCARKVDRPIAGCVPVGEAILGQLREDIGAAFGSAGYNGAGWWVAPILTEPGLYDLYVTASTLAGVNNLTRVVRVTVR